MLVRASNITETMQLSLSYELIRELRNGRYDETSNMIVFEAANDLSLEWMPSLVQVPKPHANVQSRKSEKLIVF